MRRPAVTPLGLVLASALLAGAGPAVAADTMPPEIAAIMRQMSTGTAPSPEDQQRLRSWAATSSAAASGTRAGGGSGVASPSSASTDDGGSRTVIGARDRPGGEACPAPGSAVGPAGPVSRDAFLAMAKDAVRGYGNQIPAEGRTAIDTALTNKAQPVAGADLAVALVARGSGSAAAVAAAQGALANPADPVTASTLGSVLRGMGDYRRADIAMSYAATLSPGSATLANNRGWLALTQGDTAAAATLFDQAAKLGPPSPTALLGQALIAECAGDHAKALPLFRASLKLQWSDMAAAGVQWASGSIQKAAQANGSAADLGSPEEYGPNQGGETPGWPDPPLPPTSQELAASLKPHFTAGAFPRFAQGWDDAVAANLSVAVASPVRLSETVIDDTGTTMTYGYERQLFVLDDIFAMLDARAAAGLDRFVQQTDNALRDDGVMMHNDDPKTDDMSCGFVRNRNANVYKGYFPTAMGRWTDIRKQMADLYGFSRTTLASIDDPATHANATAILESRTNLIAVAYARTVMLWADETVVAWSFKDFQCTGVPARPRPVGKLRPYKIDPNACHTGELHMNFGIINLNADCTHMNLTFGQLLQGSVDYKFGKDWGDDQVTIWAGAGFSTNGSGTSGSITAGAQAGVYATLGAGGSLVDAGISTQAGITVGATHSAAMPGGSMEPGPPPSDIGTGQGGATAQATIAARISLIDGPPNPTTGVRTQAGDGEITTSSGITFGANATAQTTSGRAMHVPP